MRGLLFLLLIPLVVVIQTALPQSALGQTVNHQWIGGAGSWFDAANWSTGEVPTGGKYYPINVADIGFFGGQAGQVTGLDVMVDNVDVLAVGSGSSFAGSQETNVFQSIQNAGVVDFPRLNLPLEAPIDIQNDGFITTQQLESHGGIVIDGVGEWLVGTGDHLFLNGGTIVNGASHLISGSGTLRIPFDSFGSLDFVNFGTVFSDDQLLLRGAMNNRGTLRTESGGLLSTFLLTNHGTVQIDSSHVSASDVTNSVSGGH